MGLKIKDFNRDRNEGYFENLAKGTQEMVKDAILEATDFIQVDMWKNDSDSLEEIECHSRDGFMAFDHNRGGLEYSNFTDLMGIWGSGYFPKATKSHDYVQVLVDYNLQSATKAFFDKNRAELGKLGIKAISKVSYHDLYECGESKLAEELSEYENEHTSGEQSSVMYNLRFMYHRKDAKGIHTASVSAAINCEAPYHRPGRNELSKEIEISWKNQNELKKKLKLSFAKVSKEIF